MDKNKIISKVMDKLNKPRLIEELTKDLESAIQEAKSKKIKGVEAGVFKNTLTSLALMAALFNAGSAYADVQQFDKTLKSLEEKTSGIVKVEGSVSGDQGKYKIEIGPYSFIGTYSGGEGKQVQHNFKRKVDLEALPSELGQYKYLSEKVKDLLENEAENIIKN